MGRSAPSDDINGLEQRANSLASSRRYAAAIDVQRRLIEARERSLGGEHPDTLVNRGRLAHWIGEAGDPAGARDQLAALLVTCERVLGPEHRGTLATSRSVCSEPSTRTPWPPAAT